MEFALPSKEEVASRLVEAHRRNDPAIEKVVRILGPREPEMSEPIKLLEVNPDTSPSGIVPIGFAAELPDIPYPSIVIEVTRDEYDLIVRRALTLPPDWRLGDTLFSASR